MDQKKIGKYIAECRRAKGLTQRTLAEQLLISDKAVSKWERGICLPNIELIVPLADILDVSVKSLLITESENKPLEDRELVVDAVHLYNKEIKKKEWCRALIVSLSILVIIVALVIIPLYAKYSSSMYDKETQNAWIQASTSIIELLDWCSAIEGDEYVVDEGMYWQLHFLINESLECISRFQTETKNGEAVNFLSMEMQKCIIENLEGLEINAGKYFSRDKQTYICNEMEQNSIDFVLTNLPKLHDNINEEMKVNSPGIAHLYP